MAAFVQAALHGGEARSQAADLSRATCADFMGLGGDDRMQLAIWLAGYYAGTASRPTVDLAKVAAAPAGIAEFCTKSPTAALIGTETRAIVLPQGNP